MVHFPSGSPLFNILPKYSDSSSCGILKVTVLLTRDSCMLTVLLLYLVLQRTLAPRGWNFWAQWRSFHGVTVPRIASAWHLVPTAVMLNYFKLVEPAYTH